MNRRDKANSATESKKDSDILADLAAKATKAIAKAGGSVVVTVMRVGDGIGIAVGSDMADVEEIRDLLTLTLRKI